MKRRAVDAAVMGLNPDIRSNPERNMKFASLATKTKQNTFLCQKQIFILYLVLSYGTCYYDVIFQNKHSWRWNLQDASGVGIQTFATLSQKDLLIMKLVMINF